MKPNDLSLNANGEFDTAILLIIFNRPAETMKVFNTIRKLQPKKLYIAADGPRPFVEGEQHRTTMARKVIDYVDWECDMRILFHDYNLGCKKAVHAAVNWMFETENKGIILEDDIVATQSFFFYCGKLLKKYEFEKKIWHISGCTLLTDFETDKSYHFSVYPGVWGWATWKDRWEKYNADLKGFYGLKSVRSLKTTNISTRYWYNVFTNIKQQKVDTWDYQWIYTIWSHGGLCITPNVNMIKNIGFGETATHTKSGNAEHSNLESFELKNLSHPDEIILDDKKDSYMMKKYFSNPSFLTHIKRKFFEK